MNFFNYFIHVGKNFHQRCVTPTNTYHTIFVYEPDDAMDIYISRICIGLIFAAMSRISMLSAC